ncbi:MAG: hypothetical protein ACI4JW_00990 [Oscillospiraceae bacterium]
MKKISLIVIFSAIILGVIGYLKPGLSIEYVRDVEAVVIDGKSNTIGSSIGKGSRRRKTSGDTYYYITFEFEDENGFEQTVKQKVSKYNFSKYGSLIGQEAKTYRLYKADIDSDNDTGDGFYLTERSGKEALYEYKESHALIVHKLAKMLSSFCLICGIFTFWLSRKRKWQQDDTSEINL